MVVRERDLALKRFIERFIRDNAEFLAGPAWKAWVERLPRDELNAAHAHFGALPEDGMRLGVGNGDDDRD